MRASFNALNRTTSKLKRNRLSVTLVEGLVRNPVRPVSLEDKDKAIAGRHKYRLADLLAQYDPQVPVPEDIKEWEAMTPAGKEIWWAEDGK